MEKTKNYKSTYLLMDNVTYLHTHIHGGWSMDEWHKVLMKGTSCVIPTLD